MNAEGYTIIGRYRPIYNWTVLSGSEVKAAIGLDWELKVVEDVYTPEGFGSFAEWLVAEEGDKVEDEEGTVGTIVKVNDDGSYTYTIDGDSEEGFLYAGSWAQIRLVV